MKLYLCSYRLPTPDELFALIGKSPIGCKLAIIPNAKDFQLPDERAMKLDELIYDIAKFGFVTEVVDLRDYDDPEPLETALTGFDAIWIAGGNTYVIRSEMRRSGFDKIIYKLLNAGMVYCGESAGAIVAGLSLEGSEVMDDPGFASEVIQEGLGLIPNILVPHADNPDYVEYVNHMKKHYKDDGRVVYIDDNKALVLTVEISADNMHTD